MSQYDPPQRRTGEPGYEVQPQRSGCGCWAWGCFGLFLFALIGFAAIGGVSYWWLTSQVVKYTSEAPQELPTVEYSEEDLETLEERLEEFADKIKSDEATEDLVLSADDLNALINSDDDLRGRLFIHIRNGQVGGDVSIPTDRVPGGKGRYFNASATFNVSMENGLLMVTLDDAEVRGEKISDRFLQAFRGENLAKDLYKNPETAAVLKRLDRVIVEDDQIVLRVRRPSEAEPPAPGDERVPEEDEPGEDHEAAELVDPQEA